MSESALRTSGKLLAVAAVVEIGTGLALLADPALFVKLLLGADIAADGRALARCFAVAALGLGLACWPGRAGTAIGASAFRGMLAYNVLIALLLAALALVEHIGGVLLWPAVALHAIMAVLLLRTFRKA